MRTAVFEGIDLTVEIAHHDDGRGADIGRNVVAGIGDLDLQTKVVPRTSPEELFLFCPKDRLVRKHPIGHAIDATLPIVKWPRALCHVLHIPLHCSHSEH